MNVRFEWDRAKAESNLQKHGIGFQAAVRVFDDPFAFSEQDRIENGEFRWRTIGLVGLHALLIVDHTVRDENENGKSRDVIRIISARRATKAEARRYAQARG
jgi:uncharacterized protein